MTPERRFGIAISVALILGGAYWALTNLTEGAKATQDSYPVQGTSLTVVSKSSDVEVVAGDVREIQVERKFKKTVFGSDPDERYRDGKLELKSNGCSFLSFGCDTDYVITVPKDLEVSVDNTSGTIKVSDVAEVGKLKTTSGDIEVHGAGGELTLDATSGDIEGTALTATKVHGKTTSGKVELTFASAPVEVRAQGTSGDVTVVVPAGAETYKVDTDTSSGDEHTDLRTDPAATRTITAKTSSGDVTVEYAN
ncbi:DUF4097 family beta strand repeat-containing protein [Kribbella italica]|uniref:DUF4097 and DUF4098 domain-containing protein YvlB n=1 Tax=Kribbella italica TaxID=1540520 RepID=A0A7W9JFV8_9ACTN|nr:DUF4097 family beta strand repeat-containing protein [Kribbella italica]MBB5841164.1 DUF4097 and DUF4098 domain-containing protein YvlB [Kribbella italica]